MTIKAILKKNIKGYYGSEWYPDILRIQEENGGYLDLEMTFYNGTKFFEELNSGYRCQLLKEDLDFLRL
jgi:hypothetical protein